MIGSLGKTAAVVSQQKYMETSLPGKKEKLCIRDCCREKALQLLQYQPLLVVFKAFEAGKMRVRRCDKAPELLILHSQRELSVCCRFPLFNPIMQSMTAIKYIYFLAKIIDKPEHFYCLTFGLFCS